LTAPSGPAPRPATVAAAAAAARVVAPKVATSGAADAAAAVAVARDGVGSGVVRSSAGGGALTSTGPCSKGGAASA